MNDKKYTRQTYSTDIVASQREYNIPIADSTDTGLKKVLNLYISVSWEFQPVKIYNSPLGDEDDYDDTTNPYAIERDGSIFIYPTPSAAITDWLRIEWTYIPLDLETTTSEANIKLAREYHDTLIMWLNSYIFGEKQLFDKQQLQKSLYDESMARMVKEWSMEIESAYIAEEPNWTDME